MTKKIPENIEDGSFLFEEIEDTLLKNHSDIIEKTSVDEDSIEIYFNRQDDATLSYDGIVREKIYEFKRKLFAKDPMIGKYPY